MKNIKKVLAIVLSAILLLAVVPMGVFAEDITIVNVTAADLDVYEDFNGSWVNGYYDENDNWVEEEWFQYECEPKNITVTYSDGSTEEYEYFWEMGGEWSHTADQTGENPWQAGNSYTAYITLPGGTQFPYTVNVLENPVESVTAEPVEMMENVDGGMQGYWDDDNVFVDNAFFEYYILPEQITVVFKDREPFVGSPNEIRDTMGYDYNYGSDQSYENQWGVGTHTAWISVLGVETEYEVKVVENPIESITVEDIEIIENSNGSFDGHYDQENNWVENSWYRYNLEPEYITVELKNGDTVDGSLWEIREEFDCYSYDCYSDQSYDNQWGIGSHTATFEFMGVKTEYNVEITESPVKSITVEDVSHIIGTNGGWNGIDIFNEETEEYDYFEWYRYEVHPDYLTVEFKDGEKVEGDYWTVCEELGYEGYCDSDQSYYNQWGIGSHTATFEFMGVKTEYNVTITESPVKSIEIEELEIIEGSNGYYYSEGYYEIDCADVKGTITFKDGSTYPANEEIKIDGDWYFVRIDTPSQDEEEWTVGNTYEATASILGVSTTFNVTITESPIESFVLKDLILYEGIDTDIDGEGEVDRVIYRYSPELSKVVLKNGTNGTIDKYNYFVYNGEQYWVYYDDIQREEPWEVGNTYEVTGYLLGKSATFNVTIKENPIEELQLVKKPDNTEVLQGGSLNLKGAVIRIGYNDGTYEDFTINDDFTAAYSKKVELKKIDRADWLSAYNEFETVGTQNAEIELFGKTCQIPVTVKENLMESISIREAADKSIIITVQNSDNTSYDMKVLDLIYCWIMGDGEGEYYASIWTDKGQYGAYIYANEDSFAIELFGATDEETEEGNTFLSNTIAASDWFKVNYCVDQHPLVWMSYFNDVEDYNGVVTAENIDQVLQLAVRLSDIEIYSDYAVISGDEIREVVAEFFAIDDIDLTLSEYYDEEKDEYLWIDMIRGGGELFKLRPNKCSYANGVWSITTYPHLDDKAFTFKFNDDLRILSYSIKFANVELREENGVMYYYENGVKSTKTGIVELDGKKIYINKGRFLGATGLVTVDGKKMYIRNGYFLGASGLVTIGGKKMYIRNGYFLGASGLVTISGKKMYISKGYFLGASGLVTISGKKAYINKGYFTGASGLVTIKGKKMYISKGYFLGASGFVTIGKKKAYINKGYFLGASGIVKVGGKRYYINKGYFTGASGKVRVGGKTYKVVKGIVK